MGGLSSGRYVREEPMQVPIADPKWVVVDAEGREVVRLWNESRAMAEIVANGINNGTTGRTGLTVWEWTP